MIQHFIFLNGIDRHCAEYTWKHFNVWKRNKKQ